MMNLIYHSDTKNLLHAFQSSEAHALLILGESGSGTLSAAIDTAGSSLIAVIQPTDIKGNTDLEKGSVRINQIRDLLERTKTSSNQLETVVIDNADTMGIPAQNAFLKLLEEPRDHLRFILTAHSTTKLLPTILSRLQKVAIQPISLMQSEALVDTFDVTDNRKRQQILYLANGLPAELTRLASDDAYFERVSTFAADARQFLQGTHAEKALIANRYHPSRSDALQFISIVIRMMSSSLRQASVRESVDTLSKLSKAHESIAAGGNIRLHLLASVI